MSTLSAATGQRSLGDPAVTYSLWPPLTSGCPRTSTEETAYPVEVDYAYESIAPSLLTSLFTPAGPASPFTPAGPASPFTPAGPASPFTPAGPASPFTPFAPAARAVPSGPYTGIDRWAPLLPPLDGPGLGEGRTPLVEIGDGLYIKDESRNPTWSHKDRLNRVTASAALRVGAPGTVVASSGNHAASAAAFAARAGLRCVVLASADTPPAVSSFIRAYGAVVLPVPAETRWPLTRLIVERCGLHPVSNLTPTHTGHAFGPEGYKTLAYEIHAEIGVPADVFVPVGYGEMLFGLWKGFDELRRLGVTDRVPRLHACEPAAGGPLSAALARDVPAARVAVGRTDAYGIDCRVGGYRGVLAVRGSGGRGLLVDDERMRAAQRELAGHGIWAELSAAAGLAAYRTHGAPRGQAPEDERGGPVVCVSTSSGFKDNAVATRAPDPVDPSWDAVAARLRKEGIGVGG